eukprot:1159566-Pelagomonas_calceolata.AAC.7
MVPALPSQANVHISGEQSCLKLALPPLLTAVANTILASSLSACILVLRPRRLLASMLPGDPSHQQCACLLASHLSSSCGTFKVCERAILDSEAHC